jgi:hypothetical protein
MTSQPHSQFTDTESDVYFTGAGPSRGHELGCIKYRDTESTSRNYTIQKGEGLIASEYHKARASTNYSFYVVRYLPEWVTRLIALYLIYIRPFAKMLFRNTQSSLKKAKTKIKARIKINSAGVKNKKIAHSVAKQASRRRQKKVRPRTVRVVSKNGDGGGDDDDDALDVGYIFCSDESPNKCWTGVELSEILQEESRNRLNVKINLWAWRHIIIGIVKAHIEEIAPFLGKDEKACREILETDIYRTIFPWLAGHQGRTNVSVYGLDAAFPGRIQPALLRIYRRISRIWHHWLGFSESEPEEQEPADNSRISNGRKRGRSSNEDEWEEEEEIGSPVIARKRQKVADSETQTTPKKGLSLSSIGVEDSPETGRWKQKAREAETALREAMRAIELRKRARNLLKETKA